MQGIGALLQAGNSHLQSRVAIRVHRRFVRRARVIRRHEAAAVVLVAVDEAAEGLAVVAHEADIDNFNAQETMK